MAAGWPTKVTYANGDVYAASDVNDTNGTLNYINPTSAVDGQILTRDNASGGKVKWAYPTFIGCRVWKSANQTISNVTGTAVTFDNEDFDTNSFHSTTVNTDRMTIPTGLSGKYLVVGTFKWAANAVGQRVGYIYVNTGLKYEVAVNNMGAVNSPVTQVTGIVSLNAGDYIQLQVYQDSGGGLNLVGSGFTYGTNFGIQYLGA